MEFVVTINNKPYSFSKIGHETYLVNNLYILYKKKDWTCADDLSSDLVDELGEAIESHLSSAV